MTEPTVCFCCYIIFVVWDPALNEICPALNEIADLTQMGGQAT
jgi:hypothetical protein